MSTEGAFKGALSEGVVHAPRGMRRPLVGISLLFVAGVLCGILCDPPFESVSGAALLCLILAFFTCRYSLSQVFIHMLIPLLGIMVFVLSGDQACPVSLAHVVPQPRVYLMVEGAIADDPVYTESQQGTACELKLQLEKVQLLEEWERAEGVLRVRVQHVTVGAFEVGQRWRMEGLLKKPRPGRQYGSDASFYTDGAHSTLVSDATPGWLDLRRLCFRARRRCARILSLGIGENTLTSRLLKALLLGYRGDLPYELREMFSTTGTFHIFAISGLHVGIVTVLLIGVLKILGVTRRYWVLWLIPLLILYTLGTGARASAVRACIMALIFWSAALFMRRPDSLSALGLAAVLILLFAPEQLGQPGFIMSFLVVAGIVMLYPTFSARVRGWLSVDTFRVRREPFLMRCWRTTVLFFADVFCVSLAAWLVSVPVTAYYFHVFCPVSLLGNVIIVPGAFLVVLTGCLSLVSGFIFPGLAEVFNFANVVFITLLLKVVELMRLLPWGHFYVKSPPLWAIGMWYAGLFFILLLKGRRRIFAILLLAVVGGFGLIGYYTDDAMHVDILNVGQGNAAFVNMPQTRNDMLIDTGSAYHAQRVISHLRRQGVDRLGVLVLTHPDRDHIGAALIVLKSIPADEIWMPDPSLFSGSVQRKSDHKLLNAVVEYASEQGIPVRYCAARQKEFRADAQIDVFWPAENLQYDAANDGTMVLRVARDGAGVLFMGGAWQRVERRLLAATCDPAAPVMVVGNHGAQGVCSASWLERVQPELAVISVGFYNAYGDPGRDVLERLEQSYVDLWRTDQDGALRIIWTSPEAGHYRAEALEER